MESTVRIGYNGSPSTPIIKIIAPKQLNEDADPKDELIRDFLRTAYVREKHQLFYLQNSFPLESPLFVSIIAPMSYFDEPEMLRKYIERRVIEFENLCECNEFYDDMKSRVTKISDKEVIVKAPANYGDYLKIREFFDWVNEQPYVEKPK